MEVNEDMYAILVARAWSDPEFAELLAKDSSAALKQVGFIPFPGVAIKVLFDSVDQYHLVIPKRPDDITEEDLLAARDGAPEALGVTPVTICPGPPSVHICIE